MAQELIYNTFGGRHPQTVFAALSVTELEQLMLKSEGGERLGDKQVK